MLAISNDFPSRQLSSPINLEVVTVFVSLVPAVTCCLVYAPLNATVEYHTELTNYLATITLLPNSILIIGDFNMPDINLSTLTGCSVISNNFCEFIFQSNLIQVVNTPTHKLGNTLDLILTDNTENIVNLTVHPLEYQCIPSDHHLITCNINTCHACMTSMPVTKDREVFDYAKGDCSNLNECLLSCDFAALYNSTDIEEIWSIFSLV